MKIKALFVLVALTSLATAQQPQQRRIVRPVDDNSFVRIAGTVHPRLANATDRGAVSPTMQLNRMMLVLPPSAEQQAALDQLLVEQQDPSSPNYHKWLTPEEFADRFGLAQADIAALSAWLTSYGFTVDEIARGRNWIAFNGTAAQVEAAFHASIHNYVSGGKAHFAASADISVPEAFSGVIAGVTGLHDFAPRPRNISARPRLTSSITGNHFMVPGDFATIYNLPSYTADPATGIKTTPCTGSTGCMDGTGQTIAIAGQTQLSTDSNPGRNGTPGANGQQYDVVTFRNLAGLPAINLTVKLKGTDPGVVTADVGEANLDIEWAGATAPNAAIIYYIEGPTNSNNGSLGAFAALLDAVSDDKAQVISISYGLCETGAGQSDLTNLTNAGVQANSQGQAIVAPSGDGGAADCDSTLPATHGLAADFPASMPYVTAIGGTTFTGDAANATDPTQPTQYWAGSTNDIVPSAFSYIPETSWNDSSGATTGTNSATGGGASVKFTKPSWQAGPGVPADGARDIPDIAFAAAPSPDGYLICSQASCVSNYRQADTTFNVIGGTSAGTPSFAGILAVYNQVKGSSQGNINSQLYPLVSTYPLAGNSNTSWAFNDITTGNNIVACQLASTGCPTSGSYGYSAGPGYDLVTGLGSVDATALIDALSNAPNPHFLVLPANRSVALSPSTSSTIAVSVAPKEGFTGNVALTCLPSSSLTGATCIYDNSTIATSGTANLTITSGSQTPINGTVAVTGTSGSATSTVNINVSVGVQDFTITSGNNTETVTQGSSTTDTITVTSVQGFSGTVTLTNPCTGTTGLTCSLSSSSVNVTSTTPGTSTLTVAAAGNASSGSVSITATSGALTHTRGISVTVNTVPPNFTVSAASPVVSIPSGTAITDNLTVAAVGSFSSDVVLTCSVPSSLNTTTCSISPSTVAGGNGTALVTITGAVLAQDRGDPLPFHHGGLGTYASLVFALGAMFTAQPARRRKTIRDGLFGLFLLIVMFGALSCGGGGSGNGGGSGPTPITGNITITGTGGGISNTATINVTVH